MRAVFQLPASMTSVVDAPARRQFGREKQSWEARTVRERPSLPALNRTLPLYSRWPSSPSADFALLMGTSSRGSKVSLISQAQMVHKGLNPYS